MCGPFSRTVTSSRGSSRLAREAAVSPAALPPIMTIFTTVSLKVLFPRFDPRIRIAFARSLDEQMAFVLADLHSLEARSADHIVKFAARECRSHRRFDVLRQSSAESCAIFGNFLLHVQPVGTFEVANEQSTFGLEDSIDFSQHGQRVVEDMQSGVGYDDIEIIRLEPHLPCVADLE